VLLEALAEAAAPQLEALSLQDATTLMALYGTFGHTPASPALFEGLLAALGRHRRALVPHSVVVLLKALAKLGLSPQPLLGELLGDAVEGHLRGYGGVETAHLLWAASTLGAGTPELYDLALRHMQALLLEAARTGTHRQIKHNVDSVAASCARVGVDARAFVEFAEMQGFIVRQPSVDEGDGGAGFASASGEWAGRAERDEPSGESGVGGGRRLLWPAEAEEAAAANAQEAPPAAADDPPAPLASAAAAAAAAANGAAQQAPPPDSDGAPAAPHGTLLPRREHADAGHSHNGGGRNGGGRGGRLLRRTPAPQHSGPAEARPV